MIYYGYNGEFTNVKTGLRYLRARYYNAENGTFTTEDDNFGTTEKPLTRNRYNYTSNNPVNYNAPTGHSLWKRIKRTVKKVVRKVARKVKAVKRKIANTVRRVAKRASTTTRKTVKRVVHTSKKTARTVITYSKEYCQSGKECSYASKANVSCSTKKRCKWISESSVKWKQTGLLS